MSHFTYHVSPAGTATNDGSAANPWSLAHAVSPNNKAMPGDAILLHGGRYFGKFTFRRSGALDMPIVYRSAQDGRVILDGKDQTMGAVNWNTVVLECRHVWLQDVEITNSEPTRITTQAGSSPESLIRRGGAIATGGFFEPNAGQGCKVINSLIYDTNGGPGQWQHSNDAELYGCTIFNNGWHSTVDGLHGHGVYFQNNGAPGKLVAENILFGNAGYGLHFFGSGNANLKFGRFVGNVSIQSNLLGGNSPLSDLLFLENFVFKERTRIGWDFGADVANVGSRVERNYCVGGYLGLEVYKHSGAVIKDNTVIGGLRIVPAAGNTITNNTTDTPTRNAIFVRPNLYDLHRWTIIVYNWEKKDVVEVATPIGAGQEWVLTDAFNPLGPPVKIGTGPTVSVPMTGLTAAAPGGNAPWRTAHPAPAFGTFILRHIGAEDPIPVPEPEPGPDPLPEVPPGDRSDLVEAMRLIDRYLG